MFLQGSQDSRKLDLEAASQYHLSSLFLMNNAAKTVADSIRQIYPFYKDPIFFLAGPGNNGNDTVLTSSLLHQAGYQTVLIEYLPEKVHPSFQSIRQDLPYDHFLLEDIESFASLYRLRKPKAIVDGLFGVGLHKKLPDLILRLFELINTLHPHPMIFSVDIPSGVSADSGMVYGKAIRADFTITFDTVKNGHLLYPGKDFSGNLLVRKIGFPDELLSVTSPGITFLDESDFLAQAWSRIPKRHDNSYKGSFGKVGIFGGSKMYPGALALSTESCLRSGTGLVYGFFPEKDREWVHPLLLKEVIRMPFSNISETEVSVWEASVKLLHTIGIGPGLGREMDYSSLLQFYMTHPSISLVIDADGLYYAKPFLTTHATKTIILTPHLGEMSMISGLPIETIQSDLLFIAKQYASLWQVILVLKSSTTIIAHPDGRYYIHSLSQSSLAKGGSGDILTGILCGLLSRKTDPFWACIAGVYLHGKIAQKAAMKLSSTSVLPSDMLLEISQVFYEWENQSNR